MATAYYHVGQTDFAVEATWYEDLTAYTAKLCYRAEGAATETQKAGATVTPGAESSVLAYEFAGADTTPFPAEGWYIFEFLITAPTGRERRCRPQRVYAHAVGSGAL